MKQRHIKVTRRSTLVDPYRGRVAKVTHSMEQKFASGGAVHDTKDPHLSGKGSPYSDAHVTRKK